MADQDEELAPFMGKILNFLSFRARSEYEISYYMLRKAWPLEVQKKIIEKLKQLKLINDEDFARQWIASKSSYRPEGISLLKLELRKKGIDKEIIERLLSEDRDAGTEEVLIEKAARQRLEKLKNLDKKQQKEKLYGFLSRRGFSSSLAVRTIDKLLEKE